MPIVMWRRSPGVILLVLWTGTGCVILDLQAQRLGDAIRSRVRVGQPTAHVLTAAEDALVEQGLPVPSYSIGAQCGSRVWTLVRRQTADEGVEFLSSSFSVDRKAGRQSTVAGADLVLNKRDALAFLDANGSGCTVRMMSGPEHLILTIGDDGKVATIESAPTSGM